MGLTSTVHGMARGMELTSIFARPHAAAYGDDTLVFVGVGSKTSVILLCIRRTASSDFFDMDEQNQWLAFGTDAPDSGTSTGTTALPATAIELLQASGTPVQTEVNTTTTVVTATLPLAMPAEQQCSVLLGMLSCGGFQRFLTKAADTTSIVLCRSCNAPLILTGGFGQGSILRLCHVDGNGALCESERCSCWECSTLMRRRLRRKLTPAKQAALLAGDSDAFLVWQTTAEAPSRVTISPYVRM